MTPEVIVECLRRAGATIEGANQIENHQITKQDMMALGLSGTADSKARRLALMKKLDLPAHMSSNALLQALNLLCSLEELQVILDKI